MEWSRQYHLENEVTPDRLQAVMRSTLLAVNAHPDYTAELSYDSANVQHLDGLYSRTQERIRDSQQLAEKAIDLINTSSDLCIPVEAPVNAWYSTRILNKFDSRKVFTLHTGELWVGYDGIPCKQVVIQESKYYTITETNIVDIAGQVFTRQDLLPRNDELLEWVEEAFAYNDDPRFLTVPAIIHAALIGNIDSMKMLEELKDHRHFGPVIQAVLDRAKMVGPHRRTHNPSGPLSSRELDQLWQVIFRIQNRPEDTDLRYSS